MVRCPGEGGGVGFGNTRYWGAKQYVPGRGIMGPIQQQQVRRERERERGVERAMGGEREGLYHSSMGPP